MVGILGTALGIPPAYPHPARLVTGGRNPGVIRCRFVFSGVIRFRFISSGKNDELTPDFPPASSS